MPNHMIPPMEIFLTEKFMIKSTLKTIPAIALALAATFSIGAFAKEGPSLATLVPIDETKFDMNSKKSVEKSDVLNRLSKETFYREIFEVKEIVKAPQTAYIVRESKPAMQKVEEDVYVRVNRAQQVNTPGWSYQNR